MAKSRGSQQQASKSPLSQWSHTRWPEFVQQQVMKTWNVVCQGSPVDTQRQKIFTESWSCRLPLPSTYQNSRVPEGKQVFSINQIVRINNWGTVIPFCHGRGTANPWWNLGMATLEVWLFSIPQNEASIMVFSYDTVQPHPHRMLELLSVPLAADTTSFPWEGVLTNGAIPVHFPCNGSL